MHNLHKILRHSALGLAGVTIISCAATPSDWIEITLPNEVFYQHRFEFNSDVIEIPLRAQQNLEYMVNLKRGGSISYDWQANNLPEPKLLLAEFHGHTIRENDAPGEIMFYKVGRNESSEGHLVAPFDGIHGWYFSNESSEAINIVLNISGFYSLIEQ
jgi:hypothetical protein